MYGLKVMSAPKIEPGSVAQSASTNHLSACSGRTSQDIVKRYVKLVANVVQAYKIFPCATFVQGKIAVAVIKKREDTICISAFSFHF